jgi:hypothetical protein
MEPASKAILDDGHGRTRIEWIVPPTVDSSFTANAATPSGRFDLLELDKLPASRAVRVMLRNAAEIEHQLFLEYLYANSSRD